MLLSQAATPITAVLPPIPPSPTMPYTGAQSTGAIRASLQRALDNYKTGNINLPPQVSDSNLSRSDTLSFGESHASELSSIDSEVSSLSAAHTTPLSSAKPLPSTDSPQHQSQSPTLPIDVSTLNNSPAPMSIPAVATVPDPGNPAQTLPAIMPTIAETGIPVSPDPTSPGPGPSRGSLLDIRGQGSTPFDSQKYESAEEEKKRLAAAYLQQESTKVVAPVAQVAPSVSEPSRTAATAATPQSEVAEEEKKRLEREEREKALQGDQNPTSSKGNEEELPPYEEPNQ